MEKDFTLWEQVRQLLLDNFPDDTDEELKKKFNALYNYPDDWPGGEIELYTPTFRGIVLRIGIRCVGTDKVSFISTPAECELRQILNV